MPSAASGESFRIVSMPISYAILASEAGLGNFKSETDNENASNDVVSAGSPKEARLGAVESEPDTEVLARELWESDMGECKIAFVRTSGGCVREKIRLTNGTRAGPRRTTAND